MKGDIGHVDQDHKDDDGPGQQEQEARSWGPYPVPSSLYTTLHSTRPPVDALLSTWPRGHADTMPSEVIPELADRYSHMGNAHTIPEMSLIRI